MKRFFLVAALVAIGVSSASAQLNPSNPNTVMYADEFLGVDGNGTAEATIGGIEVDWDGYVGARPGDTFVVHMIANGWALDGWPQVGSYRTAFWYDYNITTRGIERTDWSDTSGTFSNGPYVTDYTGYTMIDRYHGTNSQASIYGGLNIISWEFTVLPTAAIGATMEIGLEFRCWAPGYAGGYRIYEFESNYGALTLEILPPAGVLGDFDGDDDVDADDIDILCANMGGDVGTYDMDGDLDVDEDDMVYHVENLVELSAGGPGTKRGDFNLDGIVNATDLAVMKPNFGLSGMLYSQGNANCDSIINGTDLAILAGNLGFVAPTGAVPEPISLSLMAIGGVALLRRRSR